MNGARKKVAILGGGVAALTTAWYLATRDEHRELDITIYQMGFRLGGKCASGRNLEPGYGLRNEEHGIHLLFGSYHTAWDVLTEVFDDLDRPADHPLATLEKCFEPQGELIMAERLDGELRRWPFYLPPNGAAPWVDRKTRRRHTLPLSPAEWPGALARVLDGWIGRVLEVGDASRMPPAVARVLEGLWSGPRDAQGALLAPIGALFGETRRVLARLARHATGPLVRLARLVARAGSDPRAAAAAERLLVRLERYVETLLSVPWGRYMRGMFALFAATTRGLMRDRPQRWEDLDDWDFREWLVERGGLARDVADGPLLGMVYMSSFCHEDGERDRPSYAAGNALYTIARTLGDYQGAWMYYFRAPTGEVLAVPFYELLREKYGVRFEFFQKVEALRLDAEGRVARVEIDEQARVRGGGAYDPLLSFEGMRVWPSRPDAAQLEDGERLAGVDLESYWERSPLSRRRVLERGKDYDVLVLGLSIGAFRHVAGELVERSEPFRAMVEHIKSVATANCQLWTYKSPGELGAASVVSGQRFALCCDLWPMTGIADFTQQAWTEAEKVGGIFYFSNPWNEPHRRPFSDHEHPARERERLYEVCRGWFDEHLGEVIPGLFRTDEHGRRVMAYEELVAPSHLVGEDRLRAQFYRVNIDPTERYVLSVPGSGRYRLDPGRSGFPGLYLCGDWTRTAIDAGSVDAAMQSGIRCAQAILAEIAS